MIKKHTEKSILDLLNGFYISTAKYSVNNSYIFNWESDFFILQRQSGYSYEIEVKISRSDFFKDKSKKEKHMILRTGKRIKKTRDENNDRHDTLVDHDFRPNKFFYCVPEDMVQPHEVPDYAGLMYVDNVGVSTIKKAPFLHRNKLEYRTILCDKFYAYWNNVQSGNRMLQMEINGLKTELFNLKTTEK